MCQSAAHWTGRPLTLTRSVSVCVCVCARGFVRSGAYCVCVCVLFSPFRPPGHALSLSLILWQIYCFLVSVGVTVVPFLFCLFPFQYGVVIHDDPKCKHNLLWWIPFNFSICSAYWHMDKKHTRFVIGALRFRNSTYTYWLFYLGEDWLCLCQG